MFNVVRKIALAEGSGYESQYKKKEKVVEAPVTLLDMRGKNWTCKTEVFTPLNVPKESLVTIIEEKYGVRDPTPMRPQTLHDQDKSKYYGFH